MNDFKGMSDRYRQQMMDIYNRYPKDSQRQNGNGSNNTNTSNSNNTTNNTTINIHTDGNTTNFSHLSDTGDVLSNSSGAAPIQGSTVGSDVSKSDTTDGSLSIEEKYPEPVIPPYVYESNHPEGAAPKVQEGTGYLKVSATSAYRTIPLPNVSVIVSREVDGGHEILYTLLTDDSGETDTVELPAPPKSLSEKPSTSTVKPYAEYNVSTYLDGYYQTVNQKVPVFDGVTSVQSVNMVPLPAYTEGRVVNTVTVPEKEPKL